jgi:hypothetical protein
VDASEDHEHSRYEDEPRHDSPCDRDIVSPEAGVGGGEQGDLEDECEEREESSKESKKREGRRRVESQAAGE